VSCLVNSFGKQETLNFFLFSDQILVGKLGGRRDALFSRIDVQLVHAQGQGRSSGRGDGGARRPPPIVSRARGSSSGSRSESLGDADLDCMHDSEASTIVFQSPRESFLIFAR
jgi:hypothetical protein